MELSINVHKVNTQNVYFTEKKKNIIVDGDFTKILYSTDVFEMNGLYILFKFDSLHFYSLSKLPSVSKDTMASQQNWIQVNRTSKRTFAFSNASKLNMDLVERLCQIEKDIIERYIASNCPSKTASYILKNQLVSGTIKYHSIDEANQNSKTLLKISGVWETETNVGITMKFILLNE